MVLAGERVRASDFNSMDNLPQGIVGMATPISSYVEDVGIV